MLCYEQTVYNMPNDISPQAERDNVLIMIIVHLIVICGQVAINHHYRGTSTVLNIVITVITPENIPHRVWLTFYVLQIEFNFFNAQ